MFCTQTYLFALFEPFVHSVFRLAVDRHNLADFAQIVEGFDHLVAGAFLARR